MNSGRSVCTLSDWCDGDMMKPELNVSDRGSKKLVVFDVEGVLVPRNRYLFLDLGKRLGYPQLAKMVLYGALYELGVISLKSAMTRVFRFFKGFRVEELLSIFRQVPVMAGMPEALGALKSRGFRIALISSGLPRFVVQDLAARLDADYAFGFDSEIEDGMVTGQISGAVIERNGKLQVLESILEAEGFASEDCVVVADDRNNAPMLLPKTLKIGYNPDFVVRMKADHVVGGNPQEILSLISGRAPAKRRTPSANEIVREVIHAGGFAVPFIMHAIGLSRIAFLILLVTVLYVVSEFMMVEKKSLPVISSITRRAATLQELHEFGAAPIFFAVGILLTLIIFPTPASSAAVAIFTIGDSTASIFGKMFGKTELSFNKGKTLEGSLIGLALAFLAATIFVSPLKAFAGALVAMVIESLPLPLNDNLIVPLAAAVTLTLLA